MRVAGYVSGHAEHGADEEIARQAAGGGLPNISDYWPDAPHRRPATGASAADSPGWQILLPTTPRPTVPSGPSRASGPGGPAGLGAGGDGGGDDSPARRWLRPALLAGLLAMVLGSGTLLLVRTANDKDDRPGAAAPPPAAAPSSPVPTGPASVAPPPPSEAAPTATPTPTAPGTPEQTAPAPPPPAKPLPERVHFILDDGVTELSVRTSDLDDEPFQVSTPDDSGLDVDTTFRNGQLRVDTDSDGKGSGKLTVQLNKKIIWHLQLNAGVRLGEFDLGSGTVSRIDLDGGAERFDISLGRLFSTLPIRMTGGVNKWRIETAEKVPVKLNIGNGAGEVDIYGESDDGVGKRETIRTGDIRDRPGLDIDAAAGLGSLRISQP